MRTAGSVIAVVKKTFRLQNALFVGTLLPSSFFQNIIIRISIGHYKANAASVNFSGAVRG